MARYIYLAKSQPHQTIQGDIEAESEQEAINKLTQIGYFPISLNPQDLSLDQQGILSFRKISNRDIVILTRQLSSLIGSGINILNSVNITSSQSANKYLKAILNDLASKIKDGKSLSKSLSLHPNLFSSLYTSMIYSGEVGGNLELVLKRLADFLEKEEEFKNSLRLALTYPIFILVASGLTIIVLLSFVIPRMVNMFEDMGEVLPLPTKIVISASDSLRANGWFILAIIFICIFLLNRLDQSHQGRILLDRFKLKLAIWGNIILKTEVSRLMRTLSLLLSSGIPIISALAISASVLENQILKLQMEKFKAQIAGGMSFSQCLSESKLFSLLVTNIVSIGEESGRIENSLLRIADDYEREIDRTLKTLTRLLEPVIILIMGLIVGFIVVAMLLPIFQINLIVR